MSDQPLSGKVGLDTTDFKTAISEMARDIRVIESGFRASAAALGDWSSSATGVEARIKALTAEIGIQQQRVAALQAEYQRVAAEKGATSRAAEELQIKINKETETLGKMQTELGQSEEKLTELGSSSEEAGQDLDKLESESGGASSALEKLKSIASGLSAAFKVGAAAIAGLAAAAAGVGAAIAGLVLKTADMAGELTDMSLKTGISTERLQELAYVGEQVGTSSDTITGSLSRLTRSMDTARQQTQDYGTALDQAKAKGSETAPELGEMAAAFQQLGVSVTNADGSLRDSEAVFQDAITALGKVSSEADRDALAMSIFGKSAMELNPLIKAGADEINRLSQEAHDVGAVMSGEDVAAMEAFGDTLASLKSGLQGTLGTLATAFLPGFQGLATTAQTYLGQFSEVVRGADGDLVKMAQGIGGLVGQIANDIAQRGPEMLQAGLNIIQGILDAITTNLPALVAAATGILASLVQFLVQNLPTLIQSGVQIVLGLVNAIIQNLPALVEAGVMALISLIEGIASALPELIPAITEAIVTIVQTLIEHLPEIIEAGITLLTALIEGILAALPILIESAPEIVDALINALIVLLPLLAEAGLQLLSEIATAIVEALPLIVDAAGRLIETLVNGIADLASTVWDVGKSIVEGVWEGIQNSAGWFADQISNFFAGMVDAAKSALGISSPSAVFADIGKNAGGSYIDSLSTALENGQRALQMAFGQTALSLNANMPALAPATATAMPAVGNIQINLYGVPGDPGVVSKAAQGGVLAALRKVGAK